MSPSSSNDWIVPTIATSASVILALTAGPSLIESDFVARCLLSANQLQARRLAKYRSRFWQSHVSFKISNHDSDVQLLVKDEDLKRFVQDCLQKGADDSSKSLEILAVGNDEKQPNSNELYVWILLHGNHYQAPLKKFGMLMADVMENTMSTKALCIVADASGGLGNQLISDILNQCTDLNVVRSLSFLSSLFKVNNSVYFSIMHPFSILFPFPQPVLSETTWLAQFAVLVEDALLSRHALQRCMFGLVRLETYWMPQQCKTACISLPGMAVTAPLLPILQACFPCDRHVFIYDGCVDVLRRRSHHVGSRWAYAPPLSRSLTQQVLTLADALQNVSISVAETTECWMTSVDAMLRLKEEEKTNEYLPFVCRLKFILSQGSDTDRNLAVRNLLEYMTGSKSRPLPENTIKNAQTVVDDYKMRSHVSPMNVELQRSIEDCVFRHKLILLGDKILMDTVIPNKDWTLKAAKKVSGCSCCAPEDEDEDGDTINTLAAQVLERVNSTLPKPAYMDGKTTFAFDPTRFG
jgi:hypothetical protein